MDAETAIETKIKPQLIEAFGQYIANSLLTRATIAYMTTKGDEKERYRAFIHCLCSDHRVVSKWGEEGAAKRKEEWEALVEASPN